MNVDLPAPFGPSRPVMPGGTRHDHVVQADDLAVPLRQMIGDDDGRPLTRPPRRRARGARAPSADSRDQADDHQQRHRPRRVVARLQPEDDVAHLRRGWPRSTSTTAACCRVDRVEHAVDAPGEEDDAGVEDRRRSGCSSTATTAPASSNDASDDLRCSAKHRDRRKQEEVVRRGR